MALTDKQRGVRRGAATALVLSLAGVFAAPFIPALPHASDDVSARLAFALCWDLLLALTLIAYVGRLAQQRFFNPEDIDGGGLSSGTDRAKLLQATLQNTLEQVVLASIVHLVWAVSVPIAWTASLPIAAALFVIGRVLFARGYERGAPGRAAGFGLTFYPSVLMSFALVILFISGVVLP